MSKHTPGPWKWVEDRSDPDTLPKLVSGTAKAEGEAVEILNFGFGAQYDNACGDPPSEADARLIAAAPTMYEALLVAEQFLEIASDWRLDDAEINGEMRSTYHWLDLIRAALRAAGSDAPSKGETK